jgi:S-adenosyl-L-methionine hydrolase (adenosine-forming)
MARPRRDVRPRLVTLATDIGPAYAAQVKAVLLGSLDPSRIVDLTHELPAHAVAEAAFVVRAIGARFPAGTVHLVIVDPGVGGRRAPIVIECHDGSRLVGPDNGVLFPLAEELGFGRGYRIVPDRLPPGSARVGTTFDGRDLFAPAAAVLAENGAPASLGPPLAPREFRIPEAERGPNGADGQVVHVDHFGNLISNIPTEWVPARTHRLRVQLGSVRPRWLPWSTSYEEIGSRREGLLGSSFGTIEIAVAEGRAAERFRARVGSRLRLAWDRKPRPGSVVKSPRRPKRG